MNMLTPKELEIMRRNGRIHQKIFSAIQKIITPGMSAKTLDDLAADMCQDA
jgi:methionine aminopeptidase